MNDKSKISKNLYKIHCELRYGKFDLSIIDREQWSTR